MAKLYDIYFTLEAPACVTVEVEEGKSILDTFEEFTNAELLSKIKNAIDFAGYKITNIEKIDE